MAPVYQAQYSVLYIPQSPLILTIAIYGTYYYQLYLEGEKSQT